MSDFLGACVVTCVVCVVRMCGRVFLSVRTTANVVGTSAISVLVLLYVFLYS